MNFEGEKMKFFIGTILGYIVGMLIHYLVFNQFSWSFAAGVLTAIILFSLILKGLRRVR